MKPSKPGPDIFLQSFVALTRPAVPRCALSLSLQKSDLGGKPEVFSFTNMNLFSFPKSMSDRQTDRQADAHTHSCTHAAVTAIDWGELDGIRSVFQDGCTDKCCIQKTSLHPSFQPLENKSKCPLSVFLLTWRNPRWASHICVPRLMCEMIIWLSKAFCHQQGSLLYQVQRKVQINWPKFLCPSPLCVDCLFVLCC